MQSATNRLKHYDQLPGDPFCQVNVQRAGAGVFQAGGTAQTNAWRWKGVGCGFNDPRRASTAGACERGTVSSEAGSGRTVQSSEAMVRNVDVHFRCKGTSLWNLGRRPAPSCLESLSPPGMNRQGVRRRRGDKWLLRQPRDEVAVVLRRCGQLGVRK